MNYYNDGFVHKHCLFHVVVVYVAPVLCLLFSLHVNWRYCDDIVSGVIYIVIYVQIVVFYPASDCILVFCNVGILY